MLAGAMGRVVELGPTMGCYWNGPRVSSSVTLSLLRTHANGSIKRGNKDNATESVSLRTGIGVQLKDIKVFNRARQKGASGTPGVSAPRAVLLSADSRPGWAPTAGRRGQRDGNKWATVSSSKDPVAPRAEPVPSSASSGSGER